VIALEDVTFAYKRPPRLVVDGFSASFLPAAVTAVTGDNGCGKTTVTKLIVGIERPLSGRVLVDGTDIAALSIAEIGRRVGCVYQHPARQLFCTSVRAEMSYGLRNLGLAQAEIAERIDHYLAYFDLARHIDAFPLHLSHGEKQRLMLAVILSMRPGYVILDEPTTGLDPVRRRALGTYIREVAQDDACGVIVVSHDRGFVARYADAEVRMGRSGRAGGSEGSRLP
jgi:energy-coupling factor transport system ATP-binding protein